MKNKISALLAVLALFLPVLGGCAFSEQNSPVDNYMTDKENSSDISGITDTASAEGSDLAGSSEAEHSATQEYYDHDRIVWEGLPAFESDFFGRPDPEPPHVSIDKTSFMEYGTAKRKFKDECCNQIPYLFCFGKKMSLGFDAEDNPIFSEAYYGVTSYVENQTVCVKIYDYTGEKALTLYQIEGMDKGSNETAALPTDTAVNELLSIDTSNFGSGLYRITAKFSSGKSAKLYFYVNNDEVWLCRAIAPSNSEPFASMSRLNKVAALMNDNGITPENSLDLNNIYYPVKAVDEDHRCDTESWAQLSKDIVEEDWSEERKLFAFYEWMRKNLAYDYYQYKNIITTRAIHYGVFDGTYSVLDTHAGNCLDFAHILLIMCRANGIPAVILESRTENHSWNAVYINDRWIELDMTYGIKNALYTEEMENIVYSDSHKVMGFEVIPNATLYLPEDTTVNKFLAVR